MILGVSHIVLGSSSLERDALRLGALGYDKTFVETGLSTHPGKLPFMARPSTHQGLAFLAAPTGPAVELIHYGDDLPPGEGPFQLVLAASLPDDATSATIDVSVGAAFAEARLPAPRAGRIARLDTPLLFGAREPAAGIIVHRVRDLGAARSFWTALGWSTPKASAIGDTVSGGENWARMDFSSALAQWRASMILVESGAAIATSLLDEPGFRCLSFVTSDLRKDGDLLRRAGAVASTGLMEYVINGKNLLLEIFAGPDGAMIELLEVKRARS